MNRIVKVSGVEIVLNGHSVFRSADKSWHNFVPISIYKEMAAAIHIDFTNPFDFIFDNINKLYKIGILRDKAIEDFNDGRCFCGDVFKFSHVDFKYNVHFKCRKCGKEVVFRFIR